MGVENRPFPPEIHLRRENFSPNHRFLVEMHPQNLRILTPSGNGRYRVPVADLPLIRAKVCRKWKNGRYCDQNKGANMRYFGKMASYNGLPDGSKIRAFYGVFRGWFGGIRGRNGRIFGVGEGHIRVGSFGFPFCKGYITDGGPGETTHPAREKYARFESGFPFSDPAPFRKSPYRAPIGSAWKNRLN